MAYKYKPPAVIDPRGTLRAQIVEEIRKWNDAAGSTIIPDYDLPMKGDVTDPAQPATVVLHLRGSRAVAAERARSVMAKCAKEGCEAEIVFVTSPNGAHLPLDALPIPDAVVAERFAVLYSLDPTSFEEPPRVFAWHRKGDGEYAAAFRDGIELRSSHFATCVAPATFSRKGKR